MDFYAQAKKYKEEIIAHRRFFHKNAEVGLDMPIARAYIWEKLKELGITPKECGHGVTATIGSGTPVILLRADMDALPMPEESGEPFACPTGQQAHACGHDMHAAMLLGAAKLLKENERARKGTVKLMFQPAEETLQGCRDMVDAGVLNDPPVDAALAFHVAGGKLPLGMFMYNAGGVMMYSVNGFRIDIQGKGGHGAYPDLTIDPINIAVHMYTALESMVLKETEASKKAMLTIGRLSGGQTSNVIPDTAVIEGTLRTNDEQCRNKLFGRIQEIAHLTARTFGGEATVTTLSSVPTLVCEKAFTERIVEYMRELSVPNITPVPNMSANASEDFAVIAQQVPAAMLYISAGFDDERGAYAAHNPKVRFNEEALPMGAAGLAHCATRWLNDH